MQLLRHQQQVHLKRTMPRCMLIWQHTARKQMLPSQLSQLLKWRSSQSIPNHRHQQRVHLKHTMPRCMLIFQRIPNRQHQQQVHPKRTMPRCMLIWQHTGRRQMLLIMSRKSKLHMANLRTPRPAKTGRGTMQGNPHCPRKVQPQMPRRVSHPFVIAEQELSITIGKVLNPRRMVPISLRMESWMLATTLLRKKRNLTTAWQLNRRKQRMKLLLKGNELEQRQPQPTTEPQQNMLLLLREPRQQPSRRS